MTAVASETTTTQRDRHLATIGEAWAHGLAARSGYNRRSLVETAMYRYKTIIGRRLHARTLPNQRTEAKIGCNVLNRMTRLGMPVSARIRLIREAGRRRHQRSIHAPRRQRRDRRRPPRLVFQATFGREETPSTPVSLAATLAGKIWVMT